MTGERPASSTWTHGALITVDDPGRRLGDAPATWFISGFIAGWRGLLEPEAQRYMQVIRGREANKQRWWDGYREGALALAQDRRIAPQKDLYAARYRRLQAALERAFEAQGPGQDARCPPCVGCPHIALCATSERACDLFAVYLGQARTGKGIRQVCRLPTREAYETCFAPEDRDVGRPQAESV